MKNKIDSKASKYAKEYRNKNKERLREYYKKWYNTNKDIHMANVKAYYNKHKTRLITYQKEYKIKNIDKIRIWKAKKLKSEPRLTEKEKGAHQKAKEAWNKWWNGMEES